MTDFAADERQAHAEDELRHILMTPLNRVRALAFAAAIVRTMTDSGEPIGVRPTYVVRLVRKALADARFSYRMACLTGDEEGTIEAAALTIHRLVTKDLRRKGVSVLRHYQYAHARSA